MSNIQRGAAREHICLAILEVEQLLPQDDEGHDTIHNIRFGPLWQGADLVGAWDAVSSLVNNSGGEENAIDVPRIFWAHMAHAARHIIAAAASQLTPQITGSPDAYASPK